MDKLFERHDEYLSTTPMDFMRRFAEQIGISFENFGKNGHNNLEGTEKSIIFAVENYA